MEKQKEIAADEEKKIEVAEQYSKRHASDGNLKENDKKSVGAMKTNMVSITVKMFSVSVIH